LESFSIKPDDQEVVFLDATFVVNAYQREVVMEGSN
jgi:hypothetical protein